MHLADFDYALPKHLIARHPPAERRASRLLVVDCAADRLIDASFTDLPDYLRPRDLLVLNDTRVLKARLRGRKQSGGRIEVLIERLLGEEVALAHVKASKSPGPGAALVFGADHRATVAGRHGELFELQFDRPVTDVMEQSGEVPLPPYLERAAEQTDEERYQTVYARNAGAVAAPTAGLHFDKTLLAELEQRGIGHAFVTLHVGAGTFQALRHERVSDNRLHAERLVVSSDAAARVRETRDRGGRIVAVGTTSVRALEAAAGHEGGPRAFDGETDLFIYPGYRFRSVDMLLTNFHLPKSSLLMLVAALAGRERILDAYRHAVEQQYRFFSYGDAMLIIPDTGR